MFAFLRVGNTPSFWLPSIFIASVTMATKPRPKCPRGRQRQPKQAHAGLPNAHHQGRLDYAYFARTSTSLPAAAAGRTVCPAAAAGRPAPARATHAWSERPQRCALGKLACTRLGCCCRPRRHPERSFAAIVNQERRKIWVKYLKTRIGWHG